MASTQTTDTAAQESSPRKSALARAVALLAALVCLLAATQPRAAPATADGEPATGDGEPAAADGEPAAGDGEPAAADGEPEAGDGEPEAADAEPEAADGEPEAADAQPVVSAEGAEQSEEPIPSLATEPAVEPVDEGWSMPTLAWLGFGVGAAGLVIGSATGAVALDKTMEIEDQCDADKLCPERLESTASNVRVVAGVSTVSFILSGVGVTGGVLALLLDGDEPEPSSQEAVELRPTLAPGMVGLSGRF